MSAPKQPLRLRTSLHTFRRQSVVGGRALARDLLWLDGRPRWYEGRVVWEDERGLMAPDSHDLALAGAALDQLAVLPPSAGLFLGGVGAGRIRLRRYHDRLALAERLASLHGPDLPALVQPVHLRHPQALGRLAILLAAEAVCLGPLPALPSAALASCGERAIPPLCATLIRNDVAAPGRALAALLFGALGGDFEALPISDAPMEPWLHRAYLWGQQAGLPPDPALLVALLIDAQGSMLARRCARALQSASLFRLEPELLRELLDRGMSPADLVAAAEAAAEAAPLGLQMIGQQRPLGADAPRPLRALAERLLQQRQSAVVDLAAVLREALITSLDAAVVPLLFRVAAQMLSLGPLTPELSAALVATLRAGLTLPPRALRRYLTLLVERHETLWQPGTLGPHPTAPALATWLSTRQATVIAQATDGIRSQSRRIHR